MGNIESKDKDYIMEDFAALENSFAFAGDDEDTKTKKFVSAINSEMEGQKIKEEAGK